MVVHLVGLIFATLMVFAGSGSLKGLADVNKVYLLAGVFGVFIIFSVANSVTLVGASLTVSLMVIAQLLFATIIDSFGLFGTEKIPFDLSKLIGLIVMIVGVVIFKSRG